VVTTNGAGIVSHVGTVLLAEVADRFGLTAAFSEAMHGTRRRSGGHDPGRVLVDLAVAIADGAETIADLRVLSDQQLLHGPVASTATAWRVLHSANAPRFSALRAARVVARERAWLTRGEVTGQALPPSRAAGRDIAELVIDVDATLVDVHSDKQGASVPSHV
jgi:Transposase DDE domain group 1